jgi:hypothetical protein
MLYVESTPRPPSSPALASDTDIAEALPPSVFEVAGQDCDSMVECPFTDVGFMSKEECERRDYVKVRASHKPH